MPSTPLRFGLLSTAGIARKNWRAIRLSGNSIITAVASRDPAAAAQFIHECQAHTPFPTTPAAVGGYDQLLARPDVDAVYVPLPTGLRADWVIRAAEAGKHVICEKPCARDAEELTRMLEACERNGVQFLDGVMFMHSRRLDRIRELLDDGRSVGRLRRIESAFSFNGGEAFRTSNIRMHAGLEPHGCLGDLGWYCLRFSLWAMREVMPVEVTGRILQADGRTDSPHTVPVEFSAELRFADGVSASFYCSFQTGHQQWAVLSGTEGYLRLADFVLPFHGSDVAVEHNQAVFAVAGCSFPMEPHQTRVAVQEYSDGHATSQETNLYRKFANQVLSGTLNPEWPAIAWRTQRLLDICLESARLGRPLPVT